MKVMFRMILSVFAVMGTMQSISANEAPHAVAPAGERLELKTLVREAFHFLGSDVATFITQAEKNGIPRDFLARKGEIIATIRRNEQNLLDKYEKLKKFHQDIDRALGRLASQEEESIKKLSEIGGQLDRANAVRNKLSDMKVLCEMNAARFAIIDWFIGRHENDDTPADLFGETAPFLDLLESSRGFIDSELIGMGAEARSDDALFREIEKVRETNRDQYNSCRERVYTLAERLARKSKRN